MHLTWTKPMTPMRQACAYGRSGRAMWRWQSHSSQKYWVSGDGRPPAVLLRIGCSRRKHRRPPSDRSDVSNSEAIHRGDVCVCVLVCVSAVAADDWLTTPGPPGRTIHPSRNRSVCRIVLYHSFDYFFVVCLRYYRTHRWAQNAPDKLAGCHSNDLTWQTLFQMAIPVHSEIPVLR